LSPGRPDGAGTGFLRRRFDYAQILVLQAQPDMDGIGSFASLVSLGEMVQATEDISSEYDQRAA